MKRSLIIACTIVIAGFLSAFMSIEGYYGDIWQQLAMSQEDAKESIFPKLVDRGGVKKFADPAIEAKDELWKRCFRSGEGTNTAARAYATQWLKELH